MKFRAHETFFIRKGWLAKGLKYVESSGGEVFISKENNPMDVLGIGANMVKSLRYWLQATGLTEEPPTGKRVQSMTEFGALVFKNDRYIEERGTLQLLQYKLASNEPLVTSWYYFFNEFKLREFSKDDFLAGVQNYAAMRNGADKSAGTLRTWSDDFSCIVGTYLPRAKISAEKTSPENNIDCPLGELGLIDVLSKKNGTYRKASLSASSAEMWAMLAVMHDNANGKKEIALNDLLNAPCNIGRIYNLDSITLLEILRKAETLGELKIIRTAGLDVIRFTHTGYRYIDCVKKYYESIAQGEAA